LTEKACFLCLRSRARHIRTWQARPFGGKRVLRGGRTVYERLCDDFEEGPSGGVKGYIINIAIPCEQLTRGYTVKIF
jgi:hypothetical protein